MSDDDGDRGTVRAPGKVTVTPGAADLTLRLPEGMEARMVSEDDYPPVRMPEKSEARAVENEESVNDRPSLDDMLARLPEDRRRRVEERVAELIREEARAVQ